MRAGPGARITVPGPLDPGLLCDATHYGAAPIPVRIAVGAAAAQRVLDAVGHPADDLGDIAAGLGDRIAHGRPAGRAGGRRRRPSVRAAVSDNRRRCIDGLVDPVCDRHRRAADQALSLAPARPG